jgi:anti-sigma regulatory factor (Ser/Thr protein kinase)
VTAAILAVAVAGGIVAWRGYQSTRASALREIQQQATAAARNADTFVSDRLALLSTLASARGYSATQRGSIDRFLVRINPTAHGFSAGIGWIDARGYLWAASIPIPARLIPIDARSRQYVRDLLRTGTRQVSGVLFAQILRVPVIVMSVPTYGSDRRLNGILTGSTELGRLEQSERALRFGSTSVRILDSTGHLVIGNAPVTSITTPLAPSQLALMHSRRAGVLQHVSGALGDNRVIAFASVPIANWTVLVDVSPGALFGDARQKLEIELAALLAVVILSLIGAGLMARQLGNSLEREREARLRTELLEAHATRVAALPSVPAVAGATVDTLASLGLATAAIYLVRDKQLDLIAARGVSDRVRDLTAHLPAEADTPVAEVIRTGAPIQTNTIEEFTARYPHLRGVAQELRFNSTIAMPLKTVDGRTIGSLRVSATEPQWLDEGRRALLFGLAAECGVALERARLLEQEHQIASQLQHSLLPDQLITHERLSLGCSYYAGDPSLEVGGDWYETLHLPDGRVAITVGDVVGHGLAATMAMGRLRATLAALAPTCISPAELINRLEVFAEQIPGGASSTVTCAFIHPETGQLAYASAGHPPILAIEPSGSARFLERGRSWPLTFPAGQERYDAYETLTPGSALLFYSDGLIERRRDRVDDRLSRLRETAKALAHREPQQLCDELLARMTADAPPEDDIVILAVKLLPAVQLLDARLPAEPSQLAPLRSRLRELMDQEMIAVADRERIMLALGEACANVVKHAYDPQQQGEMRVTISREDHALLAVVADQGRWRSPRLESDCGRGTLIMRELSNSFDRTHVASGTSVSLRFDLDTDQEL